MLLNEHFFFFAFLQRLSQMLLKGNENSDVKNEDAIKKIISGTLKGNRVVRLKLNDCILFKISSI